MRKLCARGIPLLLVPLCFSCSSPGPGWSCSHSGGGLLLSDERAVGPEEVGREFRPNLSPNESVDEQRVAFNLNVTAKLLSVWAERE